MCIEAQRRWEREDSNLKRAVREAQVSAALAERRDTLAAGKVRWNDKVPTVNKIARTVANKAQEKSKTANAKNVANDKPKKVWKGSQGGKLAQSQQRQEIQIDEALVDKPEKQKGKQKLRIQGGR